MTDPVTAAIAGGLQFGLQVAGQQSQAKAQQNAANYNARIAQNNAIIAEENVRKAQIEGAKEEQIQRNKTANMIGTQRATLGASGVDINSGTSADLQASTASMGYEDLLTIRGNSQAKQDQLHQQATDFTNESAMKIAEGRNARKAGNLQTAQTALSTATNFAQMGQSQGWFK